MICFKSLHYCITYFCCSPKITDITWLFYNSYNNAQTIQGRMPPEKAPKFRSFFVSETPVPGQMLKDSETVKKTGKEET